MSRPFCREPAPLVTRWRSRTVAKGALREALDEDDTLERLRRVAVERMEAGDPAFWKMLLDRVWPARLEVTGEDGGPLTFAALAQRARGCDEIASGEQ